MRTKLVRRRGSEVEPGVETLRHGFRRDPVRIGHKRVERDLHAAVGQCLQEGGLAIIQVGAICDFDLACMFGIDQRLRSSRPREQNTALLEGLADCRDPKAERVGIKSLAAGTKLGLRRNLHVGLVDAAAREDQRTGIELDLMVAHHHEDLDLVRRPAVAEQQYGRSQTRFDDFSHRRS